MLITKLLEDLRVLLHAIQQLISELKHKANRIERFVISQLEIHMLPIAPGNSPEFTATPVPATSVPATPPTWTSSDTTNAPITVDPTGLIATVNIPETAVVGTDFSLTVSYINPDGTVATGSVSLTIVAPPPPPSPDITAFTIEQTA